MAETTQPEEFKERPEQTTPTGDGMPAGNQLTPMIQPSQIRLGRPGQEPTIDDDAALTIAWGDYQRAQSWLDNNSWLMEWQYVDYLYQSPNYDRDWRTGNTSRAARISRFNILKNANTMTTQARRGIFSDENFFVLEPRGKLAAMDNAQDYMNAITELFLVLCDRADFQYNMELLIDCAGLQGTGLGNPGWEVKKVERVTRKRKAPPVKEEMPAGNTTTVNTEESDEFELEYEEVEESWPFFEYRRLGTTFFDEKWRTPNRPEKSAAYKIDVDYVTGNDLRAMREIDCYKNIPNDEDLKRWILNSPAGDANTPSQVAQSMNANSATVLHASGEEKDSSDDPFLRPMIKIARWSQDRVTEFVSYSGRNLVIRNEEHELGDYALGFAANWINIDNCGYGIGIGRLNAGDQRMAQGVLNEILKMIAYPMNAPLLYNTAYGNEPTQNLIMGLATLWGVNAPDGADIGKVMRYLEAPRIPTEAFTIYQKIAQEGGEDLVGANSTTMQGNLSGPRSSAMRTATGVEQVSSKADANLATPIQHFEYIIERWLQFLWRMVVRYMPTREIREILSDKYGEAIINKIDHDVMMNAKFNIKILAGDKLAAKVKIGQLIPFLLQVVQQPQIMEYYHQIGKTINYAAIMDLFLRVSELAGEQDIFIDLTPQQQQLLQASNPAAVKGKMEVVKEQARAQGQVAVEKERGAQQQQTAVVKAGAEAVAERAAEKLAGATELEDAEGRLERNTDMQTLSQGAIQE